MDDVADLEAEFCDDPLERRVRLYVAGVPDLSDYQASLAELAYSLCRDLSRSKGMPASALARELRQTLELINQEAAPSDDDGFLAGMSTPDYGGPRPDVPPSMGDKPQS